MFAQLQGKISRKLLNFDMNKFNYYKFVVS